MGGGVSPGSDCGYWVPSVGWFVGWGGGSVAFGRVGVEACGERVLAASRAWAILCSSDWGVFSVGG